MRLLLVRHGDALHPLQDPRRSLSDVGRADVTALALRLAGTRVDEIQHSGVLRAAQTASLLGEQVMSAQGMRQVTGLLPEDDPTQMELVLRHEERDLMLVGHLPFMDYLAGLLLAGDLFGGPLRFDTACAARLERTDGVWKLVEFLSPADAAPNDANPDDPDPEGASPS